MIDALPPAKGKQHEVHDVNVTNMRPNDEFYALGR